MPHVFIPLTALRSSPASGEKSTRTVCSFAVLYKLIWYVSRDLGLLGQRSPKSLKGVFRRSEQTFGLGLKRNAFAGNSCGGFLLLMLL